MNESFLAMYKIVFRSKENLKYQPIKEEKRQREAIYWEKIKDGFECKKLRTAVDKFEKNWVKFSCQPAVVLQN